MNFGKKEIQYILIGLALIIALIGSYFGISLPAPSIPSEGEGFGAQAVGYGQYGNVRIQHNLDVDGDADIDGTLNADAVDIDDAIDLASTLNVDGATTLNSTLDVDGATTLNSTADIDGATTLNGNVSLGDATSDVISVYGQMRTYDGSDNWADISDVSALSRNNGWHTSYNITGWGGETDFQAFFANTQVATTTANASIYGGELKATLKGIVATGTTTGYGVMGKVVAKTTATLPNGYGVYSRVETDGASDIITSGANYMADLSNSGTITTSRVLYTEADTWDYGADWSQGTFTAEWRGQNEETIDNATDGVVAVSGELGYLQYVVDKTAAYTVTVAESGALFTNDGASDVITFTLPAASEGLIYTFLEQDNHVVYVDPDGTEQIMSETGTAGDYIVSTAQYDSITLVSDGSNWYVTEVIGTWDEE